MAVTDEQWDAVAADIGITPEKLRDKINEIDRVDRSDPSHRKRDLPPLYYDRDLEPITLGQWAMLHESQSYRFIRRTVLPNRYWIATIWTGINEEGDDPPVVMESAVFHLDPDADRLGEPRLQTYHATVTAALAAHDGLVRRAAHLHHGP